MPHATGDTPRIDERADRQEATPAAGGNTGAASQAARAPETRA